MILVTRNERIGVLKKENAVDRNGGSQVREEPRATGKAEMKRKERSEIKKEAGWR